jgi:MFS family permease
MTQQERRGWYMVASLFATLLIIFGGGYNTVSVLVPALLKGFPNWSRAQVSLLPSVLALSAGLGVIPIGWLLDRFEARIVMIVGALACGGAFLVASQVNSLAPMIAVYLVLGVGISAATVLPAALVIANWFEARRGLAMGIAISGTTVGGMVMTLGASHVIQGWGWRAAYVALGTPMIVVAIPLVALTVRSRPTDAKTMTVAQGAEMLEGFETSEAVSTRSFWLIALANFCFGFAAAGAVVHMIAYLEGVGYRPASAALAMSLFFGVAAIGKVVMGMLADRLTARIALATAFMITAAGFSLIFAVAHVAVLATFIVLVGAAAAAPLVLLPLIVAESLGRKRYGFIAALTGGAGTVGATVGPVVAGHIFDVTGSYTGAFELFILLDLVGAIAAFACQSYAASSLPLQSAAAPASA